MWSEDIFLPWTLMGFSCLMSVLLCYNQSGCEIVWGTGHSGRNLLEALLLRLPDCLEYIVDHANGTKAYNELYLNCFYSGGFKKPIPTSHGICWTGEPSWREHNEHPPHTHTPFFEQGTTGATEQRQIASFPSSPDHIPTAFSFSHCLPPDLFHYLFI